LIFLQLRFAQNDNEHKSVGGDNDNSSTGHVNIAWKISQPLSSRETISSYSLGTSIPPTRIIGTSTQLEKSYLRLTTFPKPQDIRPLPILQRALKHVQDRYRETEDFAWVNDQLKSIRQDITVQGIRTDFCLAAYETHARILLEHGDLSEFHQCQSMIRNITSGRDICLENSMEEIDDLFMCVGEDRNSLLQQTNEHQDEFNAYQILYALVQKSFSNLTKVLGEAYNIDGTSCQHALEVVRSVIHNDFYAFFSLYDSSPNLSAYLMDFLLYRVRTEAYVRIVVSYRPTIKITRFQQMLQFPNITKTQEFLLKQNSVLILHDSKSLIEIDCKASQNNLGKNK
jgi:SAC3 family protein LENG8/THP3